MNFINDGNQYPVFSRQQITGLEKSAFADHNISACTLMQTAGQAAFTLIQQLYPKTRQVLIVAGGGNNAGDGYVLARLLKKHNIGCCVMPVVPVTQLRADARRAQHEFALDAGVHIDVSSDLPDCDLIVDAMFGTGLSRPIEGGLAAIITAVNHSPAPVLCLDIPSGLNADTGNPAGACVQASATITFIGLKSGLLTGQARDYTGEVIVDPLGLPGALISQAEKLGHTIARPSPNRLLGARRQSSYKNNHGHVLVIGGNSGYANAARLAGQAAARSGAGLVSVATHADSVAPIATACASLMVKGIDTSSDLTGLLKKADVIVLGPGLGQDRWAQKLFARVIESKLPMVVDADALRLLSQNPGQCDHWILTPHPGEAAQLLATHKEDIQSQRVACARAIQEQYAGVAILKGAGTLVCHQQQIGFCTHGNASLATGGTGDVLTGIIAGLVAQGASLADASHCAVALHGRAAESVSKAGQRGVLAEDLFTAIYTLVNE